MTQRTLAGCLFCGLLTLAGGRADADNMRSTLRCGDQVLSHGDWLYEVRTACGDPDWAQRRVEFQTVRYPVRTPCGNGSRERTCTTYVEETIPVNIDEWTYDFGRNRFVELVRFEQGQMVSVSTLGYSHKN
jgi:hypothetical protein